MDLLCRFGQEGCGVEDVVAFVGLVVSLVTLIGGLALARAYIAAARFSKPVVESLEGANRALNDRVTAAEQETAKARTQSAAAMEVATGRAAIDNLVTEVRKLTQSVVIANTEQIELIKAHEERAQSHDTLIVQSLELVVARLALDHGSHDRRAGDPRV